MFILGVLLLFPIAIFVISALQNQGQIPSSKISKKTFEPTAPYVPDQLIVRLKESYTKGELETLARKFDELGVESQEKVFKSDDPSLKNYYVLKFKQGTDIEKAGQELINLKEIEKIQPNYIDVIQEVPNDPYFGQLWGLERIEAPRVWDSVKGSNSITVAVIDSGIDYNHQDFSGRNIIKGLNLVKGNNDPMDDHGHGTHVAGTIGAVVNNNIGVSGVNWNVTLMAVKAMDKLGSGNRKVITEGIRYAADNGAKVINLSIGTPPGYTAPCKNDPIYQAAIDYALDKGVVVVAAAGNAGIDAQNSSPGSCDGVITVGNSTISDTRASNSNYGTRVNIAAPGTEIYSTRPGNTYGPRSGTSMAAPHVSGVVGLLLAAKPQLSNDQILSCLVNGGDPISPDYFIGPRLNAYKALTSCTDITPSPTTITPSVPVSPTGASGQGEPSPSPVVIPPTSAPPKPSPTAVKTYTCREDSKPSKALPGSIKIGTLICEPN